MVCCKAEVVCCKAGVVKQASLMCAALKGQQSLCGRHPQLGQAVRLVDVHAQDLLMGGPRGDRALRATPPPPTQEETHPKIKDPHPGC